MNFNEMLTFWSLKGILKIVIPDVRPNRQKVVKVKLSNSITMIAQYDERGPVNAKLYIDDGSRVELIDSVGSPKIVPYVIVMDTIESWIKDLI